MVGVPPLGQSLSSCQLLSPRAGQAALSLAFLVSKAEGRRKPYCPRRGLESWGGDRQGRREETDPAGEERSGKVHSLAPRIPWIEM